MSNQVLVNMPHFSGFWTLEGVPDVGDGSNPEINISLLVWFSDRYRYEIHETAQLMGVTSRTVYRWQSERRLPRAAAVMLLALAGARQAQVGRWRQK